MHELHVGQYGVWDCLEAILAGFLGLERFSEAQVSHKVENQAIGPLGCVDWLRPPFARCGQLIPTIHVLDYEVRCGGNGLVREHGIQDLSFPCVDHSIRAIEGIHIILIPLPHIICLVLLDVCFEIVDVCISLWLIEEHRLWANTYFVPYQDDLAWTSHEVENVRPA